MGSSLKDLASNIVKLDRFDGGNLIRWQKRIHFLLVELKVAYVLTTPKRTNEDDEEETLEDIRNQEKWDNDDEICRGHILNAMSDGLFDVYHSITTARELWDKIEARYIREDASSKKFLVFNFLNYKMVDGRRVMEQFSEIEKMLNRFNQHNMFMDETIVVSSIIDKLPPSWEEFERDLKHKKDEITLEGLANSLRVEEEFHVQENKNSQPKEEKKDKDPSTKVHMVEDGQKSNNGKRGDKAKDDPNNKKRKRKGKCFYCDKEGHYKFECRLLMKENEKEPSNNEGRNLIA